MIGDDEDLPPVMRGRDGRLCDGVTVERDGEGPKIVLSDAMRRDDDIPNFAISANGLFLIAYSAERSVILAWRAGAAGPLVHALDRARLGTLLSNDPGARRAQTRLGDDPGFRGQAFPEVDLRGNFLVLLHPSQDGQQRALPCACVAGHVDRPGETRLLPGDLAYGASVEDLWFRQRDRPRRGIHVPLVTPDEAGVAGYAIHAGAARAVEPAPARVARPVAPIPSADLTPKGEPLVYRPSSQPASCWALSDSGEYLVSLEAHATDAGDRRSPFRVCGYRWEAAAARYRFAWESTGALALVAGEGRFDAERFAAMQEACISAEVGDDGRWRASIGLAVGIHPSLGGAVAVPSSQLDVDAARKIPSPPLDVAAAFDFADESLGLVVSEGGGRGVAAYSGVRVPAEAPARAGPDGRVRFRLAWESAWDDWAAATTAALAPLVPPADGVWLLQAWIHLRVYSAQGVL